MAVAIMSGSVKSWFSEIEADYIEEIRRKPYLWDVKHPYYTKKALKKIGYDEIAEHLKSRYPEYAANFTYDLLLAKFKNLRSQYRRERRKMLSFKSGVGAEGFIPKWEHFQRLSFLDDGMTATDSCSNMDISFCSDVVCNVEDQEEEEHLEQPSVVMDFSQPSEMPTASSPTVVNCKPSSCKKRKREEGNAIDTIISSATAALERVSEVKSEDSDVLFGNYIASLLKDIKDVQKKEMLKIKIQQMIYDEKFS